MRHIAINRIRMGRVWGRTTLVCLLVVTATVARAEQAASAQIPIRPFAPASQAESSDSLHVSLSLEQMDALWTARGDMLVEVPSPAGVGTLLHLNRFEITHPGSRFIIMTPDGPAETPPPDVLLLRGRVDGKTVSHAFLAMTRDGMVNGYVEDSGQRFYLGTTPETLARGAAPSVTVVSEDSTHDMADGLSFCGVSESPLPHPDTGGARGSPPNNRGPRLAHLAIEADQPFVNLFPNPAACQAYIMQLLAATTDIYMRDINLRQSLDFVRLWPSGGEPFSPADIAGFRNYWLNNEDPSPYNFIHMLSGTRATSYAGIAYVGGTCDAGATYGISGFLNGTFASPVGPPTPLNWDVIVPTHEMGHNCGTFHTHDGYTPPIDTCGSTPTTPGRGTIMSYCHTTSGGTWNIDMWMHRRVEDVIEADLSSGGCFGYDCNGNNIPDATDIATAFSQDVNGDGVPDECQDCNGNSVLDPVDIAGGAPDVNGNGIPDACEPDCNLNGLPDPYECGLTPAIDEDGDNTPDSCQPDCNGNGVADFKDVRSGGGFADVDRNNVPDVCQDCDGNGVSDWLDLGRSENIYIADRADFVREFYSTSGYPIQSLGGGAVLDPYDCTFGVDRQLYVASYANDRVVKINVDTGAATTFVAANLGGLDGPSSLVFGPNGNLFVASRLTSSVIQYNGATGALVGTFVAGGSGGLSQPYGLVFGPNGNLFVNSGNNTVIQYNGTTGALVGTFVSAGSGGLSSPRGLAFKANGNLLVASFTSNNILEYNGTTGTFIRDFSAPYVVNGTWGLRIAPNGNVFVMRTTTSIRLLEYRESDGLYLRSIVRSDAPLVTPTGFAFRPGFINDCNANRVLDRCDPEYREVDLFVAQLLAEPPDPALVCMYDRNGDGLLNGGDIVGFIAGFLAP